jgi:hypothetical protein
MFVNFFPRTVLPQPNALNRCFVAASPFVDEQRGAFYIVWLTAGRDAAASVGTSLIPRSISPKDHLA